MLISGVQKFTTLDYPGKTACIVFTPGCNFRCGYCHNPEFVLPERIAQIKKSFIPASSFFAFLQERRGLLDGVIISGGEPTIYPDLVEFIQQIQQRGFLVKLDTNGNDPDMLEKLFAKDLVDFIAMDVKTSLEKYQELVGPKVKPVNIARSIELIKLSAVDYEFRATLIKELHDRATLEAMAKLLAGAKKFYLQTFRPGYTLDSSFAQYSAFSKQEMEDLAATHFAKFVTEVGVR